MKFSRYLIWNFLKMFLIVVCGAVLIFVGFVLMGVYFFVREKMR